MLSMQWGRFLSPAPDLPSLVSTLFGRSGGRPTSPRQLAADSDSAPAVRGSAVTAPDTGQLVELIEELIEATHDTVELLTASSTDLDRVAHVDYLSQLTRAANQKLGEL